MPRAAAASARKQQCASSTTSGRPETVPLDSIGETDSPYRFDGSAETPTVRKVVEHAALLLEADLADTIIFGHDSRVMDGMHGVTRAFMASCRTSTEPSGFLRQASTRPTPWRRFSTAIPSRA
jgi:hypothetical protein